MTTMCLNRDNLPFAVNVEGLYSQKTWEYDLKNMPFMQENTGIFIIFG